jgi:hypothetical protein
MVSEPSGTEQTYVGIKILRCDSFLLTDWTCPTIKVRASIADSR